MKSKLDNLKIWESLLCFSFSWCRIRFLYDYVEVGGFCFVPCSLQGFVSSPFRIATLSFCSLSRQVNKPAWQLQCKAIRKLKAEITKQNLRLSSEMSIPSQFIALLGMTMLWAQKLRRQLFVCCFWRWSSMRKTRHGAGSEGCPRCGAEQLRWLTDLSWSCAGQLHSLGRRSLHLHIGNFLWPVLSLLHKTESKQEDSAFTSIKLAIFGNQQQKPLKIDRNKIHEISHCCCFEFAKISIPFLTWSTYGGNLAVV